MVRDHVGSTMPELPWVERVWHIHGFTHPNGLVLPGWIACQILRNYESDTNRTEKGGAPR